MEYCITRTIDTTDLTALKQRAVEALKSEGFGVLTDIDDTLTHEGAIEPEALRALAELRAAGPEVVTA